LRQPAVLAVAISVRCLQYDAVKRVNETILDECDVKATNDRLCSLRRRAGATHLSINTMGAGFASVHEHLAALSAAADRLDLITV
jgi:hypothetical protein